MAVENLSLLRSRSTASLGRITSASGLGVTGDPNRGTYQPLRNWKSLSFLHATSTFHFGFGFFFLPFQPQLESLTFLTETLSEESESVVYTLPGLLWLASVNCLGFETHPLVHWINYAICLIRSTNPGQSQIG